MLKLLTLGLFLAGKAFAAFAFVAGGDWVDVSSGTALPLNSVTYVAHETVIVPVTYGSATRIVESFGDGTNTYTYVGTVSDAGNGQSAAIFVLKDATAGTYTLTFTLATAATYRGLGYRRYTGLDNAGTAQLLSAVANNANGTDAIATGSVTPSAQPSIVFGATVEVSGSGSTPTAGTGFTTRSAMANWDTFIGHSLTEDKRITALSATAATFTPSSGTNTFLLIGLIFPEPGAAGGGSTPAFRGTLLGVGR